MRNAETPIERKPRVDQDPGPDGAGVHRAEGLVQREGLHTVCEEAGCPNIFECWEDREATFLIGGDQCTRRCDFCQIDTGKPAALDRDEPRRVAESVRTMGLRYATVTGVARDDLPDGGAWLYADTVRAIKELNPATGVELLIPDFNGEPDQLAEVFELPPGSVGAQRRNRAPHLQADPTRLPLRAQPGRDHRRARRRSGHQEQPDPRHGRDAGRGAQALPDLHDAGCDIVTITQYLRPSARHHPVERWVKPDEFVEHAQYAEGRGFAGRDGGAAGALVLPGRPALRPSVDAARRTALTVSLVTMAKPRSTAENKAARAEAKAAAKAAGRERRASAVAGI